jgi:hypothetical protein
MKASLLARKWFRYKYIFEIFDVPHLIIELDMLPPSLSTPDFFHEDTLEFL